MLRVGAIIITLAVYPAISFAGQDAAPVEATQKSATPEESAAAQKAEKAQKAVGRVYVMRGIVTGREGVPVNISEPIFPGMLITTGEKSAALLKFDDGQLVTMQSGTIFEVREYQYDANHVENSKIDFAILEGGVRFVTGLIGQKKKLALSLLTPNAMIRGDAAKFMVVKADNEIYSKVLGGNIHVTNAAGTATFKAVESPVVQSRLVLASIFYTKPKDVFNELLSIPVVAPLIIEPAPAIVYAPKQATVPVSAVAPVTASTPAIAATSKSASALPAPAPKTATVPVPAAAPVTAPTPVIAATSKSASALPALAPKTATVPVPAVAPVTASTPAIAATSKSASALPAPAPIPETVQSSAPVTTTTTTIKTATTTVTVTVTEPAAVTTPIPAPAPTCCK